MTYLSSQEQNKRILEQGERIAALEEAVGQLTLRLNGVDDAIEGVFEVEEELLVERDHPSVRVGERVFAIPATIHGVDDFLELKGDELEFDADASVDEQLPETSAEPGSAFLFDQV